MPLPSSDLFPSPTLFPGMAGPFTQGVLNSAAPLTASSADLYNYLIVLGGMFDLVYGIVADAGFPGDTGYVPGWSSLLDPNNCPAEFLPYLAQFNGTVVPSGTAEADARAIIKAEAGMSRGTGIGGTYNSSTYPAGGAIVAAAQRNLSGTQSVTLIERTTASSTSDAYQFVLIVRPEEVINVSALTAAVNAVKPAGIIWTLVQQDAYTWVAAIHTWSADTMTWNQTANTQP